MAEPTQIKSLLEAATGEHQFSAYQLYFEKNGAAFELRGGKTSYWEDSQPVEAHTLFDLGSLTKVICTTSLLARAMDKGLCSLQDPLSKWFSFSKSIPLSGATVGDLMCHESGLIGWYPIYESLGSLSFLDWFDAHASELVITPPRRKAVYSDLGYLFLGEILKKIWGPLDSLYKNEVAGPLGLKQTVFGPVKAGKSVAATEFSLAQQELLQGTVFDENCQALGGVCSHAGLFGSANDLSHFGRAWLKVLREESDWLSHKVAWQCSHRVGRLDSSTWAYGWDTKSPIRSSCGELFSSESFGHLGYPGTSIWIDPKQNGFAIFLTNRVHPSRLDERIKRFRPMLHDEIVRFWKTL